MKGSEGAGENLRFRGRVPTRFGWSNGSEQLLLTRTETTIRIRSWPTTSLVLVRSTSGRTHTHGTLANRFSASKSYPLGFRVVCRLVSFLLVLFSIK